MPSGSARRRVERGRRSNRAGRRGEFVAGLMLRAKGYRVVARNLVVGRVELDLLVADPRRGVLVIVEVKSTRAGGADAALRVDQRKRTRLLRAASLVAAQPRARGRGVRLDLVVVRWGRLGWPRFRHVIGAWESGA